MQAIRNGYRVRPWRDWLLLASGLMLLLVLLDLVADAVYRSDGTILYWLLIAYNYPGGMPDVTEIGLVVLAAMFLCYWLSLRMLGRAALSPMRALEVLALTSLAIVSAVFALLLMLRPTYSEPPIYGALELGFGLLTGLLVLGLLVVLAHAARVGAAERQRTWPALLRPVALVAVATLIGITVAPLALLIGERPSSFTHLASASYQAQLYYLALETMPSEGPLVHLYRCDGLGVWCSEVDSLGLSGDGQGENGKLRYDSATQQLTASEGGHLVLSYPAADLFEGP